MWWRIIYHSVLSMTMTALGRAVVVCMLKPQSIRSEDYPIITNTTLPQRLPASRATITDSGRSLTSTTAYTVSQPLVPPLLSWTKIVMCNLETMQVYFMDIYSDLEYSSLGGQEHQGVIYSLLLASATLAKYAPSWSTASSPASRCSAMVQSPRPTRSQGLSKRINVVSVTALRIECLFALLSNLPPVQPWCMFS